MTNEIITATATAIAETPMMEQATSDYITTIDTTTEAGKFALLAYVNDAVSLNDYVGVELNICDAVMMPGVRKGRNGMPDQECANSYLVDTDGTAYFSQSEGVARALRMIMATFPDMGKHGERGYIPLVCTKTELPNGNTLKSLKPSLK